MLGYIIRRLLQLIPVLIGITLITFTLSFIIPGDPVRMIMGQRSDPETEARIREKFGLDKPWYVQYGRWARNLIRNPGELPQFRLRNIEGTETWNMKMQLDTLYASNGKVHRVSSDPFRREVLVRLSDEKNIALGNSGIPYKVEKISKTSGKFYAEIVDLPGAKRLVEVDPDFEILYGDEVGGIEDVERGVTYFPEFRDEGLRSGRIFNAIFNVSEEDVIEAMFDIGSANISEIGRFKTLKQMDIDKVSYDGGQIKIALKSEMGSIKFYPIMTGATLAIGGNRASITDFKPGDSVLAQIRKKQTIKLSALYDDESKDLPEVTAAIKKFSGNTNVKGVITDLIIQPPQWFDFGRSYIQHKDVKNIISGSFRNTLYLSTVAMLIAIIVGVFAGIISAVKPYSWMDYTTMTMALIGVSMPVFWLGLMLIILFQGKLGWITGTGYGEIKWFALNLGLFSLKFPWHQNIILPAITLSTVPMALIARMTRSSMLEVMNLDYIRTARAKGLSEWRVIFKHALKNSLIPIITVIGVDFAVMLAGAVLTETVFAWPGLGREIIQAIEGRDFPIVMAGVVLFAFVFVFVNLLVDILYAYVDPRIRYR